MKIGVEIYYKLYHSTLDLQIEKAKEDIALFNLTFKYIKDILKSYKPYIDTQVDILYGILMVSPSYLVKGKLSERYVYNDVLYTKEEFFEYLKTYKKNFDRLQKHKEYIKELEGKRISYVLFKKIIKKFNLKISQEIVERQYEFDLGYSLGSISLVHKKLDKPKINWGDSYVNKDNLIAEGKVPYYTEDAEDAERQGKEYKGIKWLAYYPLDNVWIYHKKTKLTSYKFKLIRAEKYDCLSLFVNNLRKRKDFNYKRYPFVENKIR